MAKRHVNSIGRIAPKLEKPAAREKLLDAAGELFYAHGISAVGIDRIIAKAGVAKMSLYNHFDSKDALVAAWLERKHTEWMAWLRTTVEKSRPAVRPLALFDALDQWFHTKEFKGCAFINVAAEIKDPRSKAFQISAAHTVDLNAAIRGWIAGACTQLSPSALDLAAQEITMLAAGAILWAALHGPTNVAARAKESAARLLEVSDR
ncbi:MAG: TetR/AcrR family transcriptional regulator [Phycisphaeraceae bacterium]|nr:TetR/AcrR family transcriptional regulator [Phycisphaeraceae bacterium]